MYGPQTPAHYPSYGVPYDPAYRTNQEVKPPPSRRLPWLLLILVVVGGVYLGQLAWKERERLLVLVNQGEQSEKARRELEARLRSVEGERSALVAVRETLQRSVVQKTSELAELKGTYDSLQEKMKEEIAKGEVAVSQSGDRLRVDLVDKILFDSGDARISKRGESVLQRVGGVLANIADKQIHVSGHTDNQPITGKLKEQFPSNWELSLARALTVVRFLQETAKVPPERLVAAGQGEYDPIASNRTDKGRSRNRRIEILLAPELDPRRVSRNKLVAQTKAASEPPPKNERKAPARE
jgi:chemotaxis protein MotB